MLICVFVSSPSYKAFLQAATVLLPIHMAWAMPQGTRNRHKSPVAEVAWFPMLLSLVYMKRHHPIYHHTRSIYHVTPPYIRLSLLLVGGYLPGTRRTLLQSSVSTGWNWRWQQRWWWGVFSCISFITYISVRHIYIYTFVYAFTHVYIFAYLRIS